MAKWKNMILRTTYCLTKMDYFRISLMKLDLQLRSICEMLQNAKRSRSEQRASPFKKFLEANSISLSRMIWIWSFCIIFLVNLVAHASSYVWLLLLVCSGTEFYCIFNLEFVAMVVKFVRCVRTVLVKFCTCYIQPTSRIIYVNFTAGLFHLVPFRLNSDATERNGTLQYRNRYPHSSTRSAYA